MSVTGIETVLMEEIGISDGYPYKLVYRRDADVLAAACAMHRIAKSDKQQSLVEKIDDAYNHITPADIELSKRIRNYYSTKLVTLTLQSTKLTKFRTDLANFISTDGESYTVDTIRMVAKLPEFYHYDTVFDGFRSRYSLNGEFQYQCGQFTVTPGIKLRRSTISQKYYQYWCNLEDGNKPVCINVESRNALLSIWDTIYSSGKSLQIAGELVNTSTDGFQHYRLNNWRICNTITVD